MDACESNYEEARGRRPSPRNATILLLLFVTGLAATSVATLAAPPAFAASNCFAVPSACGYPDATNTGVPKSTTLTPTGSFTASTDGATYSGLDVHGVVTVTADNVTIKSSKLTTGAEGAATVINLALGAENFTLEDSDVGGNGSSTNAPESNIWNHYWQNGGIRVIRSHLYGTPDNIEGSVSLVQDSFLEVNASSPGSHDENIYGHCVNLNVQHSTLFNYHPQTATVFGDAGGCNGNHYTVQNSLLAGGGFVLYPQSTSGPVPDAQTTITDNHFARCLTAPVYNAQTGGSTCQGGPDSHGIYPYGGYFGNRAAMNGPIAWEGNVWDDDLEPICLGSCSESPPPPPSGAPAGAIWTAPGTATVGTAVTLDGSASTGDAPVACTWTFENQAGDVFDTRTDCLTSFTFQEAGTKYVRLTVTDADGDTDSNRQSFSVESAAPPPQSPAPEEPAPETPAPEEPAPETPDPEEPAPETPDPEEPAPETPPAEEPAPEPAPVPPPVSLEPAPAEGPQGQPGPTPTTREAVSPRPVWKARRRVRRGEWVVLSGSASRAARPLSCTWTVESKDGTGIGNPRLGCRTGMRFDRAGRQYVRLTVRDGDGTVASLRRIIQVSGTAPSPRQERRELALRRRPAH